MADHFDYDFLRDYEQPGIGLKLANALGGIGLLGYGIATLMNVNGEHNFFSILTIIVSLLGGTCFLLFLFNGSKPFVRKGQNYIRIHNGTVFWRLGAFSQEKMIALEEVKRIDFRDREIVLRRADQSEEWLSIHRIQNKEKKEEFTNILKDVQSKLKTTD